MMYYSTKPIKKSYFSIPTNNKFPNYNKNCTKFSRCNNPRTCKTCNKIYQYKIKKNLTNHIEESIINSFENKYFIRFKNDDLKLEVNEKNSIINLFLKDFIKMKRNKNFVINSKNEYIINKEISYSQDLGYNPHLHLILLSNNIFDTNNKQFKELCNKYNISFHIENIYKVKGSYKQSITDLIGYINKYDNDTARLLSQNNILKNEKKNIKSNLFSKHNYNKTKSNIFINFLFTLSVNLNITFSKLERTLYNKIIDEAKAKEKEAKAIFARNANKLHIKNYIRLLKSLHKKLNSINHAKARKINRHKRRFKDII